MLSAYPVFASAPSPNLTLYHLLPSEPVVSSVIMTSVPALSEATFELEDEASERILSELAFTIADFRHTHIFLPDHSG